MPMSMNLISKIYYYYIRWVNWLNSTIKLRIALKENFIEVSLVKWGVMSVPSGAIRCSRGALLLAMPHTGLLDISLRLLVDISNSMQKYLGLRSQVLVLSLILWLSSEKEVQLPYPYHSLKCLDILFRPLWWLPEIFALWFLQEN